MNINKDYIWRIVKTFIQAFIPALIVGLKSLDLTQKFTWTVVISLVIPAVAAGLSAIMNIDKLKNPPETVFEEIEEDE